MEGVEPPMNRRAQFPEMRANVVDAVSALADRGRQAERWGLHEPNDLSLHVHVLYDDCQVLPDPSASVGTLIYAEEVVPLLALYQELDPMLEDLGDAPDSVYTGDERWNKVVLAATTAFEVMRRCDHANRDTEPDQ